MNTTEGCRGDCGIVGRSCTCDELPQPLMPVWLGLFGHEDHKPLRDLLIAMAVTLIACVSSAYLPMGWAL